MDNLVEILADTIVNGYSGLQSLLPSISYWYCIVQVVRDLALIKSLIISARPLADLSPQGLILSRSRAKSEGLLALHLQKLNCSFFAFMKYHH